MKKTYVIVGCSAAGSAALSALAKRDPESQIICLTRDTFDPYNICLLTKYLANKKSQEELFLYNRSFFENTRSISLLKNKTVTLIKPEEKVVILDDNQKIGYDSLLLALGTEQLISPEVQYWLENIAGTFRFYSMQDAYNIKRYIKRYNIKNVTVVGSGFTGLECADALSSMGLQVSVVEYKEKLLPKYVTSDAANWLQHIAAQAGIKIYLSDVIQGCHQIEGKIKSVRLASGKIIETGLLIFALGSEASVDLAAKSGLSVGRGIYVNQYLETNISSIFAAGDCALFESESGNFISSSTWPDAVMQGVAAARSMVGDKIAYKNPVKTYVSAFGGISIALGGTIQDADNLETTIGDGAYQILAKNRHNALVGFILLGNIEKFGSLKRALSISI